MTVAGDGLRCELKQGQHIRNGSFKLSSGFRGRKISDVLTDDNLIVSGDGNRIFEMPAYRQIGEGLRSLAESGFTDRGVGTYPRARRRITHLPFIT